MQGIEAIGSRIGEIEGRMADLGLRPADLSATGSIGAAGATGANGATDPAADVAFQGLLQSKMAQLGALTGDDSGASFDVSALTGSAGLSGATGTSGASGGTGSLDLSALLQNLPGTAGLTGSSGATGTAGTAGLPTDAATMLARLGLDRSALAGSSVASLAALAGTGPASVGSLGAAVSGAAGTRGARNAQGVPADLAAYGNGKVPAAALHGLPGAPGHSLWAPAADSFTRMTAAAKADGVTLGVTDSYRPLGVQEDLVRTKGLYKNGGLAAVPGTSQHGWGTALDLELDPAAQQWMRTHGPSFGFVEDTPREPWHWTYKG